MFNGATAGVAKVKWLEVTSDRRVECRDSFGSTPCDSFVESDFFRGLLGISLRNITVAVEGASASGNGSSSRTCSGDDAALQGVLLNVAGPEIRAKLNSQKPSEKALH